MNDFTPVSVTRSYEQIVAQIEERILRGQLLVGEKLPAERELGKQFGVSRGVVREAIKVLSAHGFVESRQGSGVFVSDNLVPTVSRAITYVSTASEESVQQLFEFRAILECAAVRWSASRRTNAEAKAIQSAAIATRTAAEAGQYADFGPIDAEFHAQLCTAARNPFLASTIAAIRVMQTDTIALFSIHPGSIQLAADHHQQIAIAIVDQNGDAAEAAMAAHIRYTAERCAELLVKREEAG